MKLDDIVDEFERIDLTEELEKLEELEEFGEFYHYKLQEWQIKNPNDLIDPNDFLIELQDEWGDDIDLVEIFNSIDLDGDINEKFLNEAGTIKIKKHTTHAQKLKKRRYTEKNKVALKRKAEIKKKKELSCSKGQVWSFKKGQCVKKKRMVGLKKLKI